MMIVTDSASNELKKVLQSEQAKDKSLVLYFAGAG